MAVRVSVGGIVLSTVAGNPYRTRSPVPSVILPVLCQRAADVAGVVGRIDWTWRFVRGVGRDGGDEVVAEPSLRRIGELVSRYCGAGPRREGLGGLRPRRKPWASRRICRDLVVVLWL